MQDIIDPGFAAQKLAACTLAALRLQVLQLIPNDSRAADEQIMTTWNGERGSECNRSEHGGCFRETRQIVAS